MLRGHGRHLLRGSDYCGPLSSILLFPSPLGRGCLSNEKGREGRQFNMLSSLFIEAHILSTPFIDIKTKRQNKNLEYDPRIKIFNDISTCW